MTFERERDGQFIGYTKNFVSAPEYGASEKGLLSTMGQQDVCIDEPGIAASLLLP